MSGPSHYGTKPGQFKTSKIHFPTSEGVSEVSERANEWAQQRARAKRAVRSKRTSERCEGTSERTSEWPSSYVSILVCSRPECSALFLFLSSSFCLSHSMSCLSFQSFLFFHLSFRPFSFALMSFESKQFLSYGIPQHTWMAFGFDNFRKIKHTRITYGPK